MTTFLEAITKHLPHGSDDFDIDQAAEQHHDRIMGHDLTIEERRRRTQRLLAGSSKPASIAG